MTPERISAETSRRGRALLPGEVVSATSSGGVVVHGFVVGRAEAHALWRLWLAERPRTGWYPLVTPVDPRALTAGSPLTERLGHGGEAALTAALAQDPETVVGEVVAAAVRDTLAQAAEDEVGEWLEELTPDRLAQRLGGTYPAPFEGDVWAYDGRWSGTELWLCLIEAGAGHELPALLPGLPHAPNWWSEPDERPLRPADHVAFLRRWHELFGTEVFFADGRNLRLVVECPPLDPVTAARVAVEQFAYCSDLCGDPPAAGDGQVRSTVWSFWWD